MGRLVAVSLTVLMLVLTGCSGSGDTTPTTPEKPTGLSVTSGSAKATVNWPAVSGATSYNLYYSTTAGVTATTGTKLANAVAPKTVSGLADGIPYFFVVTAVNGAGESIVSDEISATSMIKPAGIIASAGDGQVTVSWSAVTGATGYSVYYGTTAGVTTSTGIKIAVATSPQVVNSLTNATPYYFVVTAVNANGESSVSSEKSATPSAAPQPPASPNGRDVTSPVAGQITVTWNAVPGATLYNVYYLQAATTPTKAEVLASVPATSATASINITGLTSGATYYVLITAVNAAGESGTQTNAQAISVF